MANKFLSNKNNKKIGNLKYIINEENLNFKIKCMLKYQF